MKIATSDPLLFIAEEPIFIFRVYRLVHVDLISLVGFRSISEMLVLPRGYETC